MKHFIETVMEEYPGNRLLHFWQDARARAVELAKEQDERFVPLLEAQDKPESFFMFMHTLNSKLKEMRAAATK